MVSYLYPSKYFTKFETNEIIFYNECMFVVMIKQIYKFRKNNDCKNMVEFERFLVLLLRWLLF